MKSFKLPVYFLAAALILSITTSCSKKSTPPAKTSTYGLGIPADSSGPRYTLILHKALTTMAGIRFHLMRKILLLTMNYEPSTMDLLAQLH